ncbi:hypothetical protein [Streptomyces sp. NPDC058291]|uniref:hypothetical protein n=1 Tax=Streptomyces sp. NPDC058291 TaxID=3346427 RepID=UPI0036E8A103
MHTSHFLTWVAARLDYASAISRARRRTARAVYVPVGSSPAGATWLLTASVASLT